MFLLTFCKNPIPIDIAVVKIDDNIIGISARSIDKIDVNRFMNNFGGGGNKNEGAAVIENANINDIENKILELIKRWDYASYIYKGFKESRKKRGN